jgi:two-component system, NarL family, nitrate/nitrite response regulator NarL
VVEPATGKLSLRENQVVRELLTGARNREIACRLGLTEATVRVYLHAIGQKLNIHNRVEIALWAVRSGLFTPDPIA